MRVCEGDNRGKRLGGIKKLFLLAEVCLLLLNVVLCFPSSCGMRVNQTIHEL